MAVNNQKLNKVKTVLVSKRAIFIYKLVVILILIFSGWFLYLKYTKIVPEAGGDYSEGIIGSPESINPIFAYNQAEIDLSSLIFSGLTSFDESGNIIPDLASKWTESKDKKTYTFYLREGVKWHDDEKFTADDVVFTIGLIQHPDFEGPIAQNWDGVKVKKINDYKITFTLTDSYPYFLENTNLGILPKHLLSKVKIDELSTDPFNLNPIGTGMYQFDSFSLSGYGDINSIKLAYNEKWYREAPYIRNLSFKFYKDDNALFEAYQKREISGISTISFEKLGDLKTWENFNLYSISMPRYAALFCNQKSKIVSDKKIRQALAYGLDREKIVRDILGGFARICDSPILPGFPEYKSSIKEIGYNQEKAISVLEGAGYKDGNHDGWREKGKSNLKINLVALDNYVFKKVAEEIKTKWESIGLQVNLKIVSDSEMEDCITDKKFDVLLYGQNLGRNLDLYPFWHSTQSSFPGLNFAGYINLKTDGYLEAGHNSLSGKERELNYQKAAQLIVSDMPAIFIYSQNFTYGISDKVRGVDIKNVIFPENRFLGIKNWYINYTRQFNN